MLRYDGRDLSDLFDVTNIRWNILPPQRINDMDILGRPGTIFLSKNDGPRQIEVDVVIQEQVSLTYLEQVMEVSTHLRKKEPKELIFQQYGDWKINAIVEGQTELETIVKHGTGTINFYCPDPAFYKVSDDIWNLNATSTKTWNRYRSGNDDSMPLIKIKGTNTNGSIKIRINDVSIEFDGSLISSETLNLDSRYLTAFIEYSGMTRSAIDDLVNLDFPITRPGENIIQLTETGDASVNEITIQNNSRNM